MTLDLTIERDFSENIPLRETAEKTVTAVLSEIGCPYEPYVTLLLTDNASIREINRENREIDAPTDVLSFPYQEFSAPGDFSLSAEQPDAFMPETGELFLGDIVISSEQAESQAAEYGHSLLREYAFLIAHSVLHLCGYDHMTPDEEKEMFSLQEAALISIGITRD